MWFMWKLVFARHVKKVSGCPFWMAWAEATACAEQAFIDGCDPDINEAKAWADEAISYWD